MLKHGQSSHLWCFDWSLDILKFCRLVGGALWAGYRTFRMFSLTWGTTLLGGGTRFWEIIDSSPFLVCCLYFLHIDRGELFHHLDLAVGRHALPSPTIMDSSFWTISQDRLLLFPKLLLVVLFYRNKIVTNTLLSKVDKTMHTCDDI